jgi:cation diffusion facilitator family transporter
VPDVTDDDEHSHNRDGSHDDCDRTERAHDHGGAHAHNRGLLGRLKALAAPHRHEAADQVDAELEVSRDGVRALKLSFVGLFVTATLQAVVFVMSGSVALLGDTLHNFADALTAVPLAIAFTLGRRAATRRFTYGYGRAEDLAGVIVVLLIAASSVVAAIEAVRRLLHPHSVHSLELVAAAALVGFLGNELVARYRIRVGRRIGSAALVADGVHARADGFTSLAVLVGAAGVWAGFKQADPIIGLVITIAIAAVLRQAAREVFARLMDAVDPALLTEVEDTLRTTPGVLGLGRVRLRWIGHALRAEAEVTVDDQLSIVDAHTIAHDAEHELLHHVRRLTAAIVHANPQPVGDLTYHENIDHHATRRVDGTRVTAASELDGRS